MYWRLNTAWKLPPFGRLYGPANYNLKYWTYMCLAAEAALVGRQQQHQQPPCCFLMLHFLLSIFPNNTALVADKMLSTTLLLLFWNQTYSISIYLSILWKERERKEKNFLGKKSLLCTAPLPTNTAVYYIVFGAQGLLIIRAEWRRKKVFFFIKVITCGFLSISV